jgi:hypothetical protein
MIDTPTDLPLNPLRRLLLISLRLFKSASPPTGMERADEQYFMVPFLHKLTFRHTDPMEDEYHVKDLPIMYHIRKLSLMCSS